MYLSDWPASSAPQQHYQNRRRYSAQAWDRLRAQIAREHKLLAALDPRSPRIRPTIFQGGAR